MRNSCAVCSLAVALCLVVCVYASTVVSKEDAERAVRDAKSSVTEVRDKAQKELNDAKRLLAKVQLSKSEAAKAYTQATKAATGNQKAVQIAEKIKTLSGAVDNLYEDVHQKMDTAVSSLSALLEEAQELESEPEIQITAKGDSEDDFTEAKNKATALKAQAEELEKNITDAVNGYTGVDSKAEEMAKKAKEAQLGEFHVSAIVAVAKMETVIREGESIFTQINNKKNEVNDIVTRMQTLKEKALTKSIDSINTLIQDARNELTKATGAVDSAVKDKADMPQQKEAAEAALAKVKKDNPGERSTGRGGKS